MREALVGIAAGASQLPLIEAAKGLGLAVVAVGRDPSAPGLAAADARVVASPHDAEAVLAGLEALRPPYAGLRPAVVATRSSGAPVATVARVARTLGLPGLAPDRAEGLVSRPGRLELAGLAGLRVPLHCVPGSCEDLGRMAVRPPLIVKPAVARKGKRGIALVRDAGALEARFEEARAASADGRVECEQYVEGRDLVVTALFRDSRLSSHVSMDEDTRFRDDGAARGYGLSVPSCHAGGALERGAVSAVARFVHVLELGTGFGTFAFRVAPDALPALVAARLDLAGDLVTDGLFPRALGVDPLALVLRHLRGEEVDLPRPARAASVRFLYGDDRARLGERGFRGLECLPGVVALDAPSGPGRAADAEGTARLGRVLLEERDAAGLARAVAGLEAALGRPPA